MSGPPAAEAPSGAAAAQAAWAQWLATPAGSYLLAWEREQVSAAVANLFGYYAVQLGFLGLDALASNRMPSRLRVGLAAGAPGDGTVAPDLLVSGFDDLPFDSASIDLIVMPHQLEFCSDPHQVLREVDRVLRPEGRLVVLGFNPLSLWGLSQSVRRGPFERFLPARANLIGMPRLRDWLKLLGFDIEGGHFGCYAPACRSQQWLDRLGFLDKAGDRWWPILGASYLLSSVKRVRGVRLIGPAWKRRVPKPAPAVAAGRQALNGSVVADRYPRESAEVLPLRRRT